MFVNLTEVLYDNLMESGSLELSEMTLKRKAECEELREEIFRHGDETTKQAVVAYVEAIRRYAKSCHRDGFMSGFRCSKRQRRKRKEQQCRIYF
ncbi:MAG: hypothetical protein ACLR13_07650 [Acutalibacteraceae bacterium]